MAFLSFSASACQHESYFQKTLSEAQENDGGLGHLVRCPKRANKEPLHSCDSARARECALPDFSSCQEMAPGQQAERWKIVLATSAPHSRLSRPIRLPVRRWCCTAAYSAGAASKVTSGKGQSTSVALHRTFHAHADRTPCGAMKFTLPMQEPGLAAKSKPLMHLVLSAVSYELIPWPAAGCEELQPIHMERTTTTTGAKAMRVYAPGAEPPQALAPPCGAQASQGEKRTPHELTFLQVGRGSEALASSSCLNIGAQWGCMVHRVAAPIASISAWTASWGSG